eukprot:1438236-Rhodomonas_salina.2
MAVLQLLAAWLAVVEMKRREEHDEGKVFQILHCSAAISSSMELSWQMFLPVVPVLMRKAALQSDGRLKPVY